MFIDVVFSDEVTNLRHLADSLRSGANSEFINFLINSDADREQSHFYEDGSLKLKIRPDFETENVIIDYKSINKKDFNFSGIKKAIYNFGYAFSAAMYQNITQKRTGEFKPFYWYFICNEYPYDSLIMSAEKYAYEVSEALVLPMSGALEFERVLNVHTDIVNGGKISGLSAYVPINDEGFRVWKG